MSSRQPPSLLALASRTAFTLTVSADRFRLTRNVTHSEYVHAVDSGRPRGDCVLPPEYPDITVRFRYRLSSIEAFHPYCAPSLPWHASATRTFDSPVQAIRELYLLRSLFWCAGCRCFFEIRARFTKRTMVCNHYFFSQNPLPPSKFEIMSSFKIQNPKLYQGLRQAV
jgi:hypothetical protein